MAAKKKAAKKKGTKKKAAKKKKKFSQNTGPGTSTGIDRQLLVGQSPYFMCSGSCEHCGFAAGGALGLAVFPQFAVPVCTRKGGPARSSWGGAIVT